VTLTSRTLFYGIIYIGDVMKKYIPYILIFTSIIGVSLNVLQVNVVLVGNDKLHESISLLKYFTIQSNLLVGLYFVFYVSGKYTNSVFFNKLFGTVILSIVFTFIIYFSYLEWTYDSVGLDVPASILNHYITPMLVITFLILYREYYAYSYKDIMIWLIYPVIYLVFLLIFGGLTGDYIYPFFQVSNIGVFGVLISIILLVGFFLLLSFSLVKILSKREIT